ncbi:MAG: hypothetical protein NT051_04765, partial [Candidatus Micrarchaeota archaeon]|nr:hypothetical protein [Candidatus Micrarchaeota archaeon]
ETQNTAAHKIWGFKDFFESQGQRIVDFYEKICSLPNFDPSHRPIIEAQFSDDKIYFLQYHCCRDFEPASFVLDRPKARNEFEATLVRGATLPEGFIAKTTLLYSRNYMDGPTGLPREDGAFDLDANAFLRNLISLIMAGKRKLQMNIFDSFELESRKIASGHSTFSKLAKPQVSFYIPKSSISLLKDAGYFNQLTSIPSYVAGKDSLRGKDEHMQIDIRITSDGNKAYGEVLESKLATIPIRALGYAVGSWKHRAK